MFLSICDEILSGPVEVLALRVCSTCETSSSEHSIQGRSGGGMGEWSGGGCLHGLGWVKQLAKMVFNRLALATADSAVVVPSVRM